MDNFQELLIIHLFICIIRPIMKQSIIRDRSQCI